MSHNSIPYQDKNEELNQEIIELDSEPTSNNIRERRRIEKEEQASHRRALWDKARGEPPYYNVFNHINNQDNDLFDNELIKRKKNNQFLVKNIIRENEVLDLNNLKSNDNKYIILVPDMLFKKRMPIIISTSSDLNNKPIIHLDTESLFIGWLFGLSFVIIFYFSKYIFT